MVSFRIVAFALTFALCQAARGQTRDLLHPTKSSSGVEKVRSSVNYDSYLFLVRGGVKQELEPEGEMGAYTAILNLVADLCPHGMLPVAYGMAAGGGTGIAVAPALLLFFGTVSMYTMVSLGRACQATKQYSFAGVWRELVGPESAWVLELSMAVLTFGCCVFYSAFIGDLFSSLLGAIPRLPGIFKKRWVDLMILSIFPILPLCLMKNLSALQFTSFGGLLSVLYTVFFVLKRSMDGSYAPGGRFFALIPMKFRNPTTDSWGSVGLWSISPGTVTLMNMACVAFMAHYNGIKYYEELKDRSTDRYARVVCSGMGVAMVVFSVMMLFGFKTFGIASQALLLNNYHRSEDGMAGLARLATGFAIICGYPLMFAALKSSFLGFATEVLGKFEAAHELAENIKVSNLLQNAISTTLLAIIVSIACNQSEEDLGLVVGLIGALLGSSAAFIIPGFLNIRLFRRRELTVKGFTGEYQMNLVLIIAGMVLMAIGTLTTLGDAAKHGHVS